MTESELKSKVSQLNEQMGKIGEVIINVCDNVAIRRHGYASIEQTEAMEKFADENHLYYEPRDPAQDEGYKQLNGMIDYEFIN